GMVLARIDLSDRGQDLGRKLGRHQPSLMIAEPELPGLVGSPAPHRVVRAAQTAEGRACRHVVEVGVEAVRVRLFRFEPKLRVVGPELARVVVPPTPQRAVVAASATGRRARRDYAGRGRQVDAGHARQALDLEGDFPWIRIAGAELAVLVVSPAPERAVRL